MRAADVRLMHDRKVLLTTLSVAIGGAGGTSWDVRVPAAFSGQCDLDRGPHFALVAQTSAARIHDTSDQVLYSALRPCNAPLISPRRIRIGSWFHPKHLAERGICMVADDTRPQYTDLDMDDFRMWRDIMLAPEVPPPDSDTPHTSTKGVGPAAPGLCRGGALGGPGRRTPWVLGRAAAHRRSLLRW